MRQCPFSLKLYALCFSLVPCPMKFFKLNTPSEKYGNTTGRKGATTMTLMVKYCSGCCGRLSRATPTTPKEIQLYWARLSRHGAATKEGLCDNCGRNEAVTLYRVLS